MGRIWKFFLILVLIAIIAFIGFAFFGDLSPTQENVVEPVELQDS